MSPRFSLLAVALLATSVAQALTFSTTVSSFNSGSGSGSATISLSSLWHVPAPQIGGGTLTKVTVEMVGDVNFSSSNSNPFFDPPVTIVGYTHPVTVSGTILFFTQGGNPVFLPPYDLSFSQTVTKAPVTLLPGEGSGHTGTMNIQADDSLTAAPFLTLFNGPIILSIQKTVYPDSAFGFATASGNSTIKLTYEYTVPESGQSFLLLTGALLGLAVVRRRVSAI